MYDTGICFLERTDAGHLVQVRVYVSEPHHATSGQGWREGHDLEKKRERTLREFGRISFVTKRRST
jgi:hypothetical protein